ncbi:hypothetical protein ACH5RR_017351 [Cinchona calisaya]|uniref:Uncharacterized protein n=1 Tax=Cinchona calisaya TaxID=153742 RepID=A0ABD2ZYM0_9GENT
MAAYLYLGSRGVHQAAGAGAGAGGGASCFGKRLVRQMIGTSKRTSRAVHVSVYDKNSEDDQNQIPPTHGMQPPHSHSHSQSDNYWAPHPQTGVFGPSSTEENNHPLASAATVTEDSVLEQKTYFRPLEDLEKPPPQSSSLRGF